MVDGNVFVVRSIILQPQNGIQNTFAPYWLQYLWVSLLTNEWNEFLAILLLPYIIVPYPLSWTKGVQLGRYANRCYSLK